MVKATDARRHAVLDTPLADYQKACGYLVFFLEITLPLVPVTVAEAETPNAASVAAPEPIGRMEIVLSGGERIIVGVDVDATALARVVRTLTRQ